MNALDAASVSALVWVICYMYKIAFRRTDGLPSLADDAVSTVAILSAISFVVNSVSFLLG